MPTGAIRWVLVRDPSSQRGPLAFLCTDLDLEPAAILKRFVSRWRIETTFQEACEHLGVETQRQWSDLAFCARTPAPLLLIVLCPWVRAVRDDDLTHCERVFSAGLMHYRRWCARKPDFNRCPLAQFAHYAERASGLNC
jgi:hypothetical protein